MSSRTTTVRPTQTTTQSKSNQDTAASSQQESTTPLQERCAHCKKFLTAVKAECRFCRKTFCMEHRHPETHSPTGCAQKAKEQTRQQFQRDSGHILGAEARDRGVTHRRPGWNIEQSRQELHQRLNQRVQTLRESSGRVPSSSSSSESGSGSGNGAKKGKGKGKKTTKTKTWGAGGSRLGDTPGSGPGTGSAS